MGIEILAIGNEVLTGLTANTNAMWLSKKLCELGYEVSRHTTLPDDEEVLERGLQEATKRSTFVICTGGLGPTIDDISGPVAEKLFGKPETFPNPVGSAEGLLFKGLILLPGVPSEMKAIFDQSVAPYLLKNYPISSKRLQNRVNLCLLPERAVDPFLRELKEKFSQVELGIYPQPGVLNITFTTLTDPKGLNEACELLKIKFKENIFESETGKIDDALHHLLIAKNKTLSLAESVTGGAISSRITQNSGCSAYFMGSIVSYSNQAKQNLLYVDPQLIESRGAVSEEVAKQMAEGVLRLFDTDYSLSVTGVAGPGGGSEEKPIGLAWCGLAQKNGPTLTWKLQGRTSSRSQVIEYILLNLLSVLYLHLKKL